MTQIGSNDPFDVVFDMMQSLLSNSTAAVDNAKNGEDSV
jgi:hypothetical protein